MLTNQFSKYSPKDKAGILIQIIIPTILAIVPSDYPKKGRRKKKEGGKRKKKKKRKRVKRRETVRNTMNISSRGQNPSHKSLRSVIEFLLRRIGGTSLFPSPEKDSILKDLVVTALHTSLPYVTFHPRPTRGGWATF